MSTLLTEIPPERALTSFAELREERVERELSDFRDRPRGIYIRNDRAFIERAYDSHADLIKRWGGWRWHSPVYTTTGADTDAVFNLMHEVWNQDFRKRLKFYSDYCYSGHPISEVWPEPHWSSPLFLSRTWEDDDTDREYFTGQHRLPIRRGQAVSRALLSHVKKTFKDRDPEQLKIYLEMWQAIFARLGDLWAAKRGVRVTISCAPSDFAWLGEIECKAGSSTCYRNGGEYEQSKFNLAAVKNSFVMFFYRNVEIGDDESPDNLIRETIPDGRLWGFFTPEGALVSNIYRVSFGYADTAIKGACTKGLGIEGAVHQADCSSTALRNFDGGMVYVNGDSRIYATTPSGARAADAAIGRNISAFSNSGDTFTDRLECPGCGSEVDADLAYECYDCETRFCSACSFGCIECGDRYCNVCSDEETCGRRYCTRRICSGCRISSSPTRCSGCERFYCYTHITDGLTRQCSSCEARFCSRSSCTSQLRICVNEECARHGQLSCAECRCECPPPDETAPTVHEPTTTSADVTSEAPSTSWRDRWRDIIAEAGRNIDDFGAPEPLDPARDPRIERRIIAERTGYRPECGCYSCRSHRSRYAHLLDFDDWIEAAGYCRCGECRPTNRTRYEEYVNADASDQEDD